MGIALEEIPEQSEEYNLILGYMQRTAKDNAPQPPELADFADFAAAAGNKRKPKRLWVPPSRPCDTVTGIYRIEREGEALCFKDAGSDMLPNRRLLWHGSRLSNLVGIFSQGLRIAPPEAPASGYMFGKGIYFADMYSTSRAYCGSAHNAPAYMLLCEVALGEMYPSRQAMYMEAPQPGTNSTWGVGRCTPGWAPPAPMPLFEPGGSAVPLGVATELEGSGFSLAHNEFIVYDAAQVKMRYLVELNNFECPQEAHERCAEEKRRLDVSQRTAAELKRSRKVVAA